MSKYDFSLDMQSDNSNSIILRNILPATNVLELGCSFGRMTKHMKESLNCEITIIEYDHEAGTIAAQWAKESFIGNIGDIEKPWLNLGSLKDRNVKFDYIIFADVLEHLHNPKKVLENVKDLLDTNGSIWISIPNIAHNAVIIDLWNNKFEYRDTGLLDNTHLRFFTESSLRKMCEESGFKIAVEHNLRNMVGYTELNNSFHDVPIEVVSFMQARSHSDTYQFVWQLKL